MITKQDLLEAFYNQGRKTKRKTCNSNGTRYTMNRVLHGTVNATNTKKIDHRVRTNKGKQTDCLVFKDGEWHEVKLGKNARKKLERKGEKVKQEHNNSKQFLYAHEIKE